MTDGSINSKSLTKLQQAILDFIWSHATATAEQVREAIAEAHPLKESSVRTLLRRLEAQGYLTHSVEGQTFVYRATAARESVAAGAVRSVIERFWAGSVERFLLGMVDEKVLSRAQPGKAGAESEESEMNDLIRLALQASMQSAVLAVCVGTILAAARIRSGSVCHAAWVAVLCAMMLMPALSRFTPAIGLGVPVPHSATELDFPMPEPGFAPPAQAATGATGAPTDEVDNLPPRIDAAPTWPMAIVGIYSAGLAFLLACVANGWRLARRIARMSEPVGLSVPGARVCEWALVNTPLTIGIFSPRIVLPNSWRDWPDTKLRAVLAHEGAHVRQRHTLVSLAACVNRSIFWFHPLAWWLERKLSITAEHARDEAGVSAIGHGGAYARILLDMAGAARRQGSRFTLPVVGMQGDGGLEERIDRILRNDWKRDEPRTRRAIVAAGCAAAIFTAAACREQPRGAATLVARRQGEDQAAQVMAEARSLIRVRWNPQNAEAQRKLAELRQKLERSTDANFLLSGATPLVSMCWPTNAGPAAGMEVFAAGKAAIDRALQLDPQSSWARQLRNKVRDQELVVSLPEKIWSGPLESRRRAIHELPAGERFRELSILSISAGDEAVRAEAILHDKAGAKASWEQAGRYAQEALEAAPQARDHADFGTSLFRANMVAGMASLEEGDRKAAAEFARRGLDAPATEALQYPISNARPWPMNWQFPTILAARLLRDGDRDVVVELLEHYSRVTIADRDRWLADIALIRQGKMPAWARS